MQRMRMWWPDSFHRSLGGDAVRDFSQLAHLSSECSTEPSTTETSKHGAGGVRRPSAELCHEECLGAMPSPSSVTVDLDDFCHNFTSALKKGLNSDAFNEANSAKASREAPSNPTSTNQKSDRGIPDYDPLEKTTDELMQDALELFHRWDLIKKLRIPLSDLRSFLAIVAERMPDNEYHNFAHAVDVACYAQSLAELTGLALEMPTHLKLGFLLSALCHDLQHPGFSSHLYSHEQGLNESEMSGRLEAMHLCEAEKLLCEELPTIQGRTNLMEREEIQNCLSLLILSTDLKMHGSWSERLDQWTAGSEAPSILEQMALLLKLADISNVFRGEKLCLKWSERISREFFAEGDVLKELGITQLPHMDRKSRSAAQNTIGFLDFVAFPYLTKMKKCFKGLQPLEQNLQRNRVMLTSTLTGAIASP